MAKILLVEDDMAAAQTTKKWLAEHDYLVEIASCGQDAVQLLASFQYDVILLDWGLPDLPGIEVCRRFRKAGGTSYIIFVTGQDQFVDKEEGFAAGCDDYVVKPFDIRELALRIQTVMRRPKELLPAETRVGQVYLESRTRSVHFGTKSIQLKPKEFLILSYLMRHPGVPYNAQALYMAVWPSDSDSASDTVRTWMLNIRKNLNSIGLTDFVKTKSGLGYMVEAESSSES